MWEHFWHFVGSLSASNANKPSGKKQIATIICQVLYPPFLVSSPHFGQDKFAMILGFVSLVIEIYKNFDDWR